jgi:excisionase family DNA binding protein
MPNQEVSSQGQVLISVEVAAGRLQISRTRAWALVMRGELKSVKIGRSRRVVATSLNEYVLKLLDEEKATGELVG